MIAKLMVMLLIASLFSSIVWANSGPSKWERNPGGEVLVIDENSPIEVNRELLSFDINYFKNVEVSTAKVNATYVMHNTSTVAEVCQMAFPLISNYRTMDSAMPNITVNGEKVEYEVFAGRIVENYNNRQSKSTEVLYSFDSIVENIHTDYQEIKGLEQNTIGKLYKIEANDGSFIENTRVTAVFSDRNESTKIVTSGFYNDYRKDGNIYLSGFYGNGNGYYIFIYGGEADFYVTAFDDWKASNEVEFDFTLIESEVTYKDFYELVIEPEIDWVCNLSSDYYNPVSKYNAATKRLFDYEKDGIISMSMINEYFDSSGDDRLFTVLYEVPFQAEDINEVSVEYLMPLSYNIRNEEGLELSLEYILNPASYWKDFKN